MIKEIGLAFSEVFFKILVVVRIFLALDTPNAAQVFFKILVAVRIFLALDTPHAALVEFWQFWNCDYDH